MEVDESNISPGSIGMTMGDSEKTPERSVKKQKATNDNQSQSNGNESHIQQSATNLANDGPIGGRGGRGGGRGGRGDRGGGRAMPLPPLIRPSLQDIIQAAIESNDFSMAPSPGELKRDDVYEYWRAQQTPLIMPTEILEHETNTSQTYRANIFLGNG